MTEILLGVLLICEIVYSAYKDRLASEERKKLINALATRTPSDMAMLEATDKLKSGETEPIPPDMTSLDEVSQEDWEKVVLGDGTKQ